MSRWGNFLSGIESGLDKILQENEPEKGGATKAPEKTADQTDVSRTASTRRKPDRLQQRLNRAVEGRSSGESARSSSKSRPAAGTGDEEADKDKSERVSAEKERQTPTRVSIDKPASARASLDTGAPAVKDSPVEPAKEVEVAQDEEKDTGALQDTASVAHAGEQTETGDAYYLERIEALQAKLNLFIKEAADKAKAEQDGAGTDSAAKKRAQQDEKIAALMAEGQKLSEKELKHVGTIRRLHARTNDLESTVNKARKAEAEAQREAKSLRSRAEAAEAAQKTAASDDEAKTALTRQLEQVKKQNETQAKELAELRGDLEKARANSGLKSQLDKQKQELETEKRTAADLREELENAKIERELANTRHKSQLEEQITKANHDRERAEAKAAELESEVKTLESRMETMRTRREEETGGTGDQQVKQLRQIEALQRQYSVSKENWGSVEASLNARIASLEKERDELAKKEAELRRKLREATSSLRKRDDELDELKAVHAELEDKLQSRRQLQETTINDLKESLKKVQSDADQARDELKSAKATIAAQVEHAKSVETIDEDGVFTPHDRSQSPVAFRAKRQHSGLGLFAANGTHSERPGSSRKVSIASPQLTSNASYRQQQFPSVTRSSSRSAFREAASIDDERETSDGLRTPATPGRGFNDVVSASASNPAAGPSVQLVERMSAAVRRLESEKASTRDELDRMSTERDEARKQIVSLLEEVESKRNLEKKVEDLEVQVTETSQRYQTTLELLGEKSEVVEELKADILDMKQIYREALEKSMK